MLRDAWRWKIIRHEAAAAAAATARAAPAGVEQTTGRRKEEADVKSLELLVRLFSIPPFLSDLLLIVSRDLPLLFLVLLPFISYPLTCIRPSVVTLFLVFLGNRNPRLVRVPDFSCKWKTPVWGFTLHCGRGAKWLLFLHLRFRDMHFCEQRYSPDAAMFQLSNYGIFILRYRRFDIIIY